MNNDLSSIQPSQEELALFSYAESLRHQFWPAYTWGIQTKQLKDFDKNDPYFTKYGIDIELIKTTFSDLFDKINSSFYHLQMQKAHEEQITEIGKRIAKASQPNLPGGVLGIAGMPYEPINYEYEAMLVTLKSAIDIVVMIITPVCGLPPRVDSLYRLLEQVKKVKQPNDFFSKIQVLLASQNVQQVINEFSDSPSVKSKRNYAVHRGSLSTGTINVQYAHHTQQTGILKSKAVTVGAKMSDLRTTPDLEDYCTSLFYNTCDFLMDTLELVTNKKLLRGQKMSIHERVMSKQKNQNE